MKGSSLADVRAAGRATREGEHEGLTRDELLAAYRLMLLSRKIDDKEIQLKNQSQAFFQISGAGHEAVLVAAGRHLRAGYVWFGDGATSEGEFWESLNTACLRRLPILYLVEDNGYAISVPVEAQTPGGDLSRLVESFPSLKVYRVDGTDYVASH